MSDRTDKTEQRAAREEVAQLKELLEHVEASGYAGISEPPRSLLDRLAPGVRRRRRGAVRDWLAKKGGA